MVLPKMGCGSSKISKRKKELEDETISGAMEVVNFDDTFWWNGERCWIESSVNIPLIPINFITIRTIIVEYKQIVAIEEVEANTKY